jgi:endoglucanase
MLKRRRWRYGIVGICAFLMAVGAVLTVHAVTPAHAANDDTSAGRSLARDTRFFVPKPDQGAIQQIADLRSHKQFQDAALIQAMIQTPQAVWFTSGTPQDVQHAVRKTVDQASDERRVPVLVAYDVPGRDCSQFSAGGALTGDAYKAWIDGFVAGLGHKKAVVLVEPDGLALQPSDCGMPDTYDRVSLINYAAHAMLRDPNASVYLDAGHSAWHATGDMASRLVQGGVQDVSGFFLDVSNFNLPTHEDKYGTWISDCIAFANDPEEGGWRLGHYDFCASQYFSPVCTVDPNDFSTWGCTDQWYTQNMGTAVPTTHFVVDTSRDGQGAWTPPADHPAGDPQNWCNPPDRGLGLRPTANTKQPLVDAYLWVKIPGESDGQCNRWTSGPTDPVRNMVDPPAGQWFPTMALELVHNANPPLDVDRDR